MWVIIARAVTVGARGPSAAHMLRPSSFCMLCQQWMPARVSQWRHRAWCLPGMHIEATHLRQIQQCCSVVARHDLLCQLLFSNNLDLRCCANIIANNLLFKCCAALKTVRQQHCIDICPPSAAKYGRLQNDPGGFKRPPMVAVAAVPGDSALLPRGSATWQRCAC